MKKALQDGGNDKIEEMAVPNATEKFNHTNTKELPGGFSSMGLTVDWTKERHFLWKHASKPPCSVLQR